MPGHKTGMTDSTKVRPVSQSESSIEDRELVVEALNGDQRAFATLVKKYRSKLTFHIRRTVGANQNYEIDDLVQEAFAKAFAALHTYSTEYAFSTWLYKIATNHAIDYRRKKRLQTVSIHRPIKTREGEMELVMPDDTYRPDRHIVNSQQRDILSRAIDKLPEKYKRVIVLRHQKEMSYADIAETLDLPLGTVKAHIFRARSALYKVLRGKEDSLIF